MTIIGYQLLACSKSIFKNDQTFVVQVGTAKIDLAGTPRFTFLDQSPEQKRHAPETVKPFV